MAVRRSTTVRLAMSGGIVAFGSSVIVSCSSGTPIIAPPTTVTVNSASTVTVTADAVTVTADASDGPAADRETVIETATETVSVTVAASPAEETSATAVTSNGETTGKIGAALPLTWSGYDDSGDKTTSTGTVTLYSAKWMTEIPGDYEQKPEKGAFLVMDVGYVGNTGAVPYNSFDFNVKDAAGHEYNGAFAQLDEPALKSGDLKPGARARGSLVFDLPRGAVTLVLAPAGSFMDGELATWAIPA
jgi:hypothetical protein